MQRPRQRTFTSCTECRRRKQRCNQAKDRPCNNCARRYPPVVCTYESSSPPPTIDSIVDFKDERHGSGGGGSGYVSPGPAYVATSSSSMNVTHPTVSDGYYTSSSSSNGYYTTPTTSGRNDYQDYQGASSATPYTAYTTSGGYPTVSTGYYQSVPVSYGTPASSGEYYSSAEQNGAWLYTGDPAAFAGAGSGDYYYVPESSQGHHPPSGP